MGPIHEKRGAEQGGTLSTDEYQLVSNTELNTANSYGLGIDVGNNHIASIGAADDTVLVSDCPNKLQSLLKYSSLYDLSDPIQILLNPPQKHKLKLLVKKKVIYFWHSNLSASAKTKPSLKFLQTDYFPL